MKTISNYVSFAADDSVKVSHHDIGTMVISVGDGDFSMFFMNHELNPDEVVAVCGRLRAAIDEVESVASLALTEWTIHDYEPFSTVDPSEQCMERSPSGRHGCTEPATHKGDHGEWDGFDYTYWPATQVDPTVRDLMGEQAVAS